MMYKVHKNAIFLFSIVCVILVIIFAAYGAGFMKFFSLDTLRCYARDLMTFVTNNYWLSVFLYMVLFVGAIVLFLPVVTLLMIAGGFLFGPLEGALYSVIGATLGAFTSFMLIRILVGPWVQKY